MAKYVGQEHTMYLKICKKYSVQPEPEIKADGGKLDFNLSLLPLPILCVSNGVN